MKWNKWTIAALFSMLFVVSLVKDPILRKIGFSRAGSMSASLAKTVKPETAQTGQTVTADLIHKAQFVALVGKAIKAGAVTSAAGGGILEANGLTTAEVEDIAGRGTNDGYYGRPLTAAQKSTFINAIDKAYNAGAVDTETALHVFKACGVTCLDFEAYAVKRIQVDGGDTEAQRQAAQTAKDVYCTANGQE